MTNTKNYPTLCSLCQEHAGFEPFYSILLDTRASTMSENMYDIA